MKFSDCFNFKSVSGSGQACISGLNYSRPIYTSAPLCGFSQEELIWLVYFRIESGNHIKQKKPGLQWSEARRFFLQL